MDAKLTLKLDQQTIEQAKLFAANQRISLSHLIEQYLKSLISKDPEHKSEISPFVKSMSGKVEIPADFDYRSDYRNWLDQKHS